MRKLLDAVTDCAVVSFALWTLLYCVGLATQWKLYASGWLWLLATVALVAWQVTLVVREHRAATPEAGPADGAPAGPGSRSGGGVSRLLDDPRLTLGLLAAGAAGTVVAALGGLVWTPGTFKVTWAATVLAIGSLLAWSWLSGRAGRADVTDDGAAGDEGGVERATRGGSRNALVEDLGVLVVMAACVVASLFIHLADTDDPYYLNRSVWVAEHGNAALRDTMFSPEVFNSPYGGGIPIASIEALLGVLAHLVGARAGAVTYLVATPVATAAAVWATWRLARRWAPRRAFLVFAAAIAFLMLSGSSMLGNFWIPRMWQGKVMAVTILMPLIWAYLSELADATTPAVRRRTLALLLAAGVAFFGLTPTAVVWGPVMFGAVVLAALMTRSVLLAVGGALMLVGPVASGAAVVLFSSDVGGPDPVALSSRASFVRILGEVGPMVALGLVALCLAPVLARRGTATALAGASAFVAVVVFAPGILPLINTVTGSGPILWRMLYVAPIPLLAGLLASAPLLLERDRPVLPGGVPSGGVAAALLSPRARQGAGVLAVAALALGLAVGGRPVWAHTGHGGPVTVTSSPQWKLDVPALKDVEKLDARGMEGVVLLPPRRMKVLTMYTTDAYPVVPREWFIRNINEPRKSREARRVLFDLASGKPPLPTEEAGTRALRQLDVTLACTGKSSNVGRVVAIFEAAGYLDPQRVGSLTCLERGD